MGSSLYISSLKYTDSKYVCLYMLKKKKKKKKAIVCDEIDNLLSYPGVTYTITVPTVKVLSFRTDIFIQRRPRLDRSLENRSDQVLHSYHSICAVV